jgi:hypothetical protein
MDERELASVVDRLMCQIEAVLETENVPANVQIVARPLST